MKISSSGWERNSLLLLQLFIAVGAVGGGVFLIADPSGSSLGLPRELIEKTWFKDYFIPGIVLLTVNGLGSIAGCVMTYRRHRLYPHAAIVLGMFLIVWMVVQVLCIGLAHWQQPVYFLFGVLELFLGRKMQAQASF